MPRRLTLAAIAALFAASSSLAMLQSARPAAADPDDHWRRNAHHQRFDRDDHRRFDRDDHRRFDRDDHRRHRNGYVYSGYANPGYYNTGWFNAGQVYTQQYGPFGYYTANRSWNANSTWHHRHHRGHRNGWNNPNNPHYAGYRWTGKPHVDPWRDGRRR